jgi:heat shock protein HslJ/dipeptidyl aminopeptidase/acylaminoacyl peptidase
MNGNRREEGSMSECTEIRRLLALQRADWSAEEMRQVEAHLVGCEPCAAIARAYAEQDRWSREMPPVGLTPAQRSQVLQSAANAVARNRRKVPHPREWGAPARPTTAQLVGSAAALALIALLALGLAMLLRQGPPQETPIGIGEDTSPAATVAPEASPLAGTEWVLVSMKGEAPLVGTHVTLTFQQDQFGGFAGCNRYGGQYEATSNGKLEFGLLEITLMACASPPGVMQQEQAYVEALRASAAYRLGGDRLELADASGQAILVYDRQQAFQGNPAELPGTAWRLVSLDGRSPIDSSTITLTFQDDQQASGYAGCRDYSTTYQAAGGDLSFLTMEMIGDVCSDQALLEQEGEYTTILGWTEHYRLAQGQLELFSARGEVLTFEPLPAPGPSPAPTVATPLPGSDLGKMAWVQDGDLWIRVLPDGGPVRLTDTGGVSEPRWSPSGEWLAFRQDAQVWLIRADGQGAYAVDGSGVIDTFAWSPVEDRLAYVAGSGMLRLEVLRAGEEEPVRLLPPSAEGQPGRIAWNPLGSQIAYEWRQGMDYEGLWQVPASGGEPIELYDSGIPERGEALLAGWTANGQYLLFWQGDMLSASLLADGVPFYALPADGRQPVLLAGGDDAVLYHADFWSSSPAGGTVALTVGGGRETWTNKRIAVADVETGQLAPLTDATIAALSPAFSWRGVAYVAAPDVGFVGGGDPAREAVFQRRIWITDGDSPEPRQLTGDPAYRDERPLWSADGSHLLFVRMDQQEGVSLWLLPVDGGAPQQQVAGGLGPWPDPSPGWSGFYGHLDWDTLFGWWQEPVGTAPAPETTPMPTPTPSSLVSPHPGVADLLQNPPAPGETVELDAYFSGAGSAVTPGGPPPPPDQVACPTNLGWASALTDQPFLATLQLLNGIRGNALPEDAAWLVATTPEATQPGRVIQPQLPYLSRLRGHLGDPAFADCRDAGRIFIVEEVVAVYEEQPPVSAGQVWALPADYAAWPRYEDTELGYSLPYPPDWTVAPQDDPNLASAIALQSPRWPGYSLDVRVHAGETRYDPYDPTSLPPLMEGPGYGVYEQGWAFGQPVEGSQGLAGYAVDHAVEAGQGEEAVLLNAGGYTYELDLTYPTGFDASQALLTAYTAMVEGFRLASVPGPTPTPPVKQVLGPGPFLSEEEALARVRERDGEDVELLAAVLLSEATARQQADACGTFFGHPDGVWLFTVRGAYEGMTRTLDLYLDATTGEQLCGEEVTPRE